MTTNKVGIASLVEICARKGIKHVVISPGSRNAPLIIGFNQHPEINCISVTDERSAGFFALGIAQQTGQPVAVVCTSGSASLNYSPAIVEAFYQRVPLLILTADRPVEFIDQGEGQSIRQHNIFGNYIRKSFQLPQEINNSEDRWYNDRVVCEAIENSLFPVKGPVHINIPLKEPLYDKMEVLNEAPKIFNTVATDRILQSSELNALADKWNSSSKKLILCGMMEKSEGLNTLLERYANDPSVTVLTESTSNLFHPQFNHSIDRLISSFSDNEKEKFSPDLLITLGEQIISKKIKSFLRDNPPKEHWHVFPGNEPTDTFLSLTKLIPVKAINFFQQFESLTIPRESNYRNIWKQRDFITEDKHNDFIQNCEFSDLKAYYLVLDCIPEFSNLQIGNSKAIRYVQLFNPVRTFIYNSNRGTSGIDGSTSTAAGASYINERPTTLVCGDVSFLYDGNALWNQNLKGNLNIIVFNNQGGGIFRFIPGPSGTDELEQFFEAHHNTTVEHIAKAHDLHYLSSDNFEDLETKLTEFYTLPSDKPAILEVFTPREKNDTILKDYFKHLKNI